MNGSDTAPPAYDSYDAESAVQALQMIRDNEHGESWSAGVALSALASIDERRGLGECFWCPGQRYTMGIRLCNDDGIVETERNGEIVAYACTGGAHRFGQHIRCTSPAHGGSR